MAKNLYVLETNLVQKSEPEGHYDPDVRYCALLPEGFGYFWSNVIKMSDDTLFWQAPEINLTFP